MHFAGILRSARTVSFLLLVTGCAAAPGIKSPVTNSQSVSAENGKIVITPIDTSTIQSTLSAYKAEMELPPPTQEPVGPYRVNSRDMLSIMVWNYPQLIQSFSTAKENDLNTGIVVSEDGYIYFPYAGRIHVAGETIEQIRKQITAKLAEFIKTPQVSVSVARYASRRVYVLGEVEQPRVIPLNAYPMSVLEAITLAGGLTKTASRERAYILRDGKRYILPLGALLNKGKIKYNIKLQAGDVLQIPDNSDEKVFVLGAVRKPMAIWTAGERVSLSEVLAESGGLDPMSADASNVYVIRGNIKKPQIYHLDMESADALLLGEQFLLKPRDVVYVATSGISDWNRVLTLLLPNIQTLFYMDSLRRLH